MAFAEVRWGDLVAIVGDNAASGEHRAGYNGLWRLQHRGMSRSLFVPTYAGLNHEHIFDGVQNHRHEVFFEPRVAPMELRRLAENTWQLHQPPTPTFHLESWTVFRFTPPYYVDMSYRCSPRQHVFRNGYIGLFWASYINAPEDKSMYFLGTYGTGGPVQWVQLCTQAHNDESTVLHHSDRLQLTFAPDYRDALFRYYSRLRYQEPFFYGRFEEFTVIYMFDRTAGIRFTHSPTGGGYNRSHRTSNPAWDFQFIVPSYDVNRTYGFRMRLAVLPRCDRSRVLEEYTRWRAQLR